MIFVILLGLAFGSFINALVWRLHKKRDFVKERSVCEHCSHTLAWYDLIPLISWIWLRGRCRYCSKTISLQNPISEILMATAFGLSWAYWPVNLVSVSDWTLFGLWLAMVAVLVGLMLYDINWMILPDKLIITLGILVATSLIIILVNSDSQIDVLKDSLFGIVFGGGIFYGLFQISKGKWIGGGDVKLGFVMGAYVGALGAVIALLIGFYSAAIYIVPLMAVKKLNRKSKVPFGPFLILGFFVVGLCGSELIDIWHNWLGF